MSSKEERAALALLIADAVREGVITAIQQIVTPAPPAPPPTPYPITITVKRELTKLAVRKEAFVIANMNVFDEGIKVPGDGTVGVCVCFDTDGVLSFKRSEGGSLENFNEGVKLAAGGTYYFSFLAEKGDVLNFQYSVNAKLISMYIYFVPDIA